MGIHGGRVLLSVLLLGMMSGALATEVKSCARQGELQALCGLRGPEDMERTPDGKSLLISQVKVGMDSQGLAWGPGTLVELRLASGRLRTLYPRPGPMSSGKGAWGDSDCAGEIGADLSPHGIQLSRRKDGRWQLLLVNHGRRESVEFFELRAGNALHWRGCAVAPPGSMLNDVAAMPDGGFVVSTMVTEGAASFGAGMAKARAGGDTGHVWRWSRAEGFRKVPGSDGPMPNGVAVDSAGKYLFFSAGGVRKLDLENGTLLGVAKVANPDNLSWDGPHRLLVAGMAARPPAGTQEGASGADMSTKGPVEVVAVDTDTLAVKTLLSHDGSLLEGASVALRVDKQVYVGSFTGERLLVLPPDRHECRTGP